MRNRQSRAFGSRISSRIIGVRNLLGTNNSPLTGFLMYCGTRYATFGSAIVDLTFTSLRTSKPIFSIKFICLSHRSSVQRSKSRCGEPLGQKEGWYVSGGGFSSEVHGKWNHVAMRLFRVWEHDVWASFMEISTGFPDIVFLPSNSRFASGINTSISSYIYILGIPLPVVLL